MFLIDHKTSKYKQDDIFMQYKMSFWHCHDISKINKWYNNYIKAKYNNILSATSVNRFKASFTVCQYIAKWDTHLGIP